MVLRSILNFGIIISVFTQRLGIKHPVRFVRRIRNQLLLDTHRENGSALHSERFACRAVGQSRSTQRLAPPVPAEDDAEIREALRKFSTARPRWGWRRAATHLRNKGHQVNNKRVRRIWGEEGLRVPTRRKKKRLTGVGTHIGAMSLIRPNALWAMDFQFDRMATANRSSC